MTADFLGTTRFFRLELQEQSGGLSGTFTGIKLSGKLNGSRLELSGKGENGNAATLTGTVGESTIAGSVTLTDPHDPAPLILLLPCSPCKARDPRHSPAS